MTAFRVVVLGLLIASCGGAIGNATEFSSSTSSKPVTETSEVVDSTVPRVETTVPRARCDCYSLSEIEVSDTGRLMFTIWDQRARNLSLDDRVHHKVETLTPRPIYVAGFLAGGDEPAGVIVNGKYRLGPLPNEVPEQPRDFPLNAQFWVGFAMMDEGKIRFGDIVNHAGDVSLLLDVLEENPDLFGDIDTSRTVYLGHSMGAISGLYFSNSCCHDPRVKAVVAMSGYMADESIGFTIPYDFESGPEVLGLIGVQDAVIPYSFSSRLIGRSPRVEVLSIPDAGHGDLFEKCQEIGLHMAKFISHFLSGTPKPAWSGTCASTEVLPGGVSGSGTLGPNLVG